MQRYERGFRPGRAILFAGIVALPALLASPALSARQSVHKSAREGGGAALTGAGLADAIVGNALARLPERVDEHFEKGEYNHAVNLCRIDVQGRPYNAEAYSNAAYLLWSMAREDEAVALLQAGLSRNRNSYYMFDELGTYYAVHRKQFSDAIPYYEKAVAFKCPFSTWHALANCYEKTDQWEKALHAWQEAAKYPDDRLAPVRVRRAQAHLHAAPAGQ
jgi:tetratricopeptide (TPR) repeat protein